MEEEAPAALAETQRLLRRLITAPEGVRPALAEEGDPEGRRLVEVIRDDAPLSAVDRLEVYANAYFSRILEALEDDYPALHAALGDDRFHALISDYLIAHPPTRFSLRHAGEGLPSFVADHPAAVTLRAGFRWAADLARLEWAVVDAFDAADAAHLTREDLALLPPQGWGELRLRLDPSVRIVRAGWPVNGIREAFDAERPLPAIAPEETAVCVWRRDERVFHRPMDRIEAACLGLVSEGATFGDLCGRIALEVGESETPARALGLLTNWIGQGLLSSVPLPGPR